MRKIILLSLVFVLSALGSASAQKIAIKNNMLYDAIPTVNLGIEIGLGRRTTLDISGNYNAWDMNKAQNEKLRHMLIQPEFRYYFCEKMNGHFIGAHVHGMEYNVCGHNWLLNTFKTASTLNGFSEEKSRYQGVGYGAGIVYGYDIVLSSHFNIELAVGAGYVHLDYDRYGPDKCSAFLGSDVKDYWGLTKLGVSLVYVIK